MIGIYDTSDSFKQVRVRRLTHLLLCLAQASSQHFNVPTSSVSSLSISPTGSHIAVWDSPLEVSAPLSLDATDTSLTTRVLVQAMHIHSTWRASFYLQS